MNIRRWNRTWEEGIMAMIKSISKLMLLLVFMPFFLFAIVVWTPVRKLILG